jgi:hypothetical protein
MANYFNILMGPKPVDHSNESEWKNILNKKTAAELREESIKKNKT